MNVRLKKALGIFYAGAFLMSSPAAANDLRQRAAPPRAGEDRDEIVISLRDYPVGQFDPLQCWGLYGQTQILHSSLLKKTARLEIVGDYAKSYEISADGLRWTLHLNDGHVFSNGEPVTAEDVKFTYELLKEDGVCWDLTHLEKIEIEDPLTITFHLAKPQSTFWAYLTEIPILPRKRYGPNYASNPIGSGPYMLTQWDRDQQAILEVNPYYHGKPPHFKKVTLLFLNETIMLAAAKNGTVDMIYAIPEFADEKIDGFKLFSYESNDVRGLSLPMRKSGYGTTPAGRPVGNDVTSDIAIRRALNIGLNRQAIVDAVLNGHGKTAFSLVDKMPWWNEKTVVKDNRPEDAAKILEAAGWLDADGDGVREKKGLRAEFDLYYPSDDSLRANTAIVVAEQARELGVKINLVGSNWDEISVVMHSHAVLFAGGRHHPHQFYTMHHPDRAGILFDNIVYMDNPAVTAYMEKAMCATSMEEANKYWKLAQWDGRTGASGLGDVPYVWLIRWDHTYLGDARIDVGEQPVHSHGHDWSFLANLGEWTWNPDAGTE